MRPRATPGQITEYILVRYDKVIDRLTVDTTDVAFPAEFVKTQWAKRPEDSFIYVRMQMQ